LTEVQSGSSQQGQSQVQSGQSTPAQPVGSGDYVVRAGDCMESIAAEHGFFWQMLWDHPDNAALKQARNDPNVLLPGDRVTIPEKRPQDQPGATEQRHRFRRKGVPGRLQLTLMNGDRPRANEAYTLEVDGLLQSGTTDGDGRLDVPIPPNARLARLTIGPEHDEYVLKLGQIDPIEEVQGVQGRLKNLGFYSGTVDGILNDATSAAIAAFQGRNDLEATGRMDQATRDKLNQVYGA
jgi:hypothetical protein